jgi:indole-3-glycerol phosphate synthase
MPDFLSAMADASRERVREAKRRMSESSLLAETLAAPPPRALVLGEQAFDVVAEIKPRSPSGATTGHDSGGTAPVRASAYERGGACAISVLTEPSAFAGSLELLRDVGRRTALPAMRKDFLVDPYQVVEARAFAASGVLLIAPLLEGRLLSEMIATAAVTRLFVLLEVFDERDLERAVRALEGAPEPALVGVNARNLATLAVDVGRHAALAALAPPHMTRVAESGIETPDDAARVARLGYSAALVGSALMRSADPGALVAGMIAAGRSNALTRETAS